MSGGAVRKKKIYLAHLHLHMPSRLFHFSSRKKKENLGTRLYTTLFTVLLFYSAVDITEEQSADKTVAAVQLLTTGNPGAAGLVPTSSVNCATSSPSSGNSSLAAPNEWSHGAHWYRSSAVLLRYHK